MTKKKVIRRIKKPKVICSVCDKSVSICDTCGCEISGGDTCWCYYNKRGDGFHFCSEECERIKLMIMAWQGMSVRKERLLKKGLMTDD